MPHDRTTPDGRPVLVVEDCDDDFDTVVEAAIRVKLGNRLVRAADADKARSLLAAGPYAFMLLDYNLPGMDGLALLKIVRGDPALAELPAVIYTTSVNQRDRDAFDRAGANAFHVKSVQHPECLRTLEAIFRRWLNCVTPPSAGARG